MPTNDLLLLCAWLLYMEDYLKLSILKDMIITSDLTLIILDCLTKYL